MHQSTVAWYGFKGVPSHSSHCSGDLFHSNLGAPHLLALEGGVSEASCFTAFF